MASELWIEGLQASVAISIALAALLVLRLPLRKVLGARAAYAAWALAPLSVLAVLAPAPARDAALALVAPAAALAPSLPGIAAVPGRVELQWLLGAGWVLGVLAMALAFALQQRRFSRGLRRRPALPYDESDAGPAVIGLLRPRIVLPTDFRQRYSAEEQALVIAHERLHVQRGDLPAQALATVLRCLFWFNPLVHAAAARFRIDQELACDAAVLARFPTSRRTYGGAMLKSQLAGFGLPLGCHWQSDHPLKERLAMLKNPLPGPWRRNTGLVLLAGLLATGTWVAWASQPAAGEPVPTLQALEDEDRLDAPKYPEAAADAKLSGKVVLDILVGVDGLPKEVKVHHSEPAGVFDQAATDAAWKWKFNAGRGGADGGKVEGWVRVPVQFDADGDPPESTKQE